MEPKRTILLLTCLVGALGLDAWCQTAQTATATSSTMESSQITSAALATKPLDWRKRLASVEFTKSGEGEWLSPSVETPFGFDELIYCWNVRLPRPEAFRIYLQVGFAPGDQSPWLYAGYWGDPKTSETKRKVPTFDRGSLEQDQLLLKAKANSFRFKVVDEGRSPLSTLPSLGVIATDNHPETDQTSKPATLFADTHCTSRILDVPLRPQQNGAGIPTPDRCQSAALASAMQYFGTSVPLDRIFPYTTDPEYGAFGIWPRTLGGAYEMGFDAYIDRFRDWDSVKATVAQNKVILCSITVPADGGYIASPYKSMGGHIVALCGVTDDGRVIVTDSAKAAGGEGHCLQWLREDFEKVWMKRKGGVGMVICPPAGAEPHYVDNLPPFPAARLRK